jgi:hypothetical protein
MADNQRNNYWNIHWQAKADCDAALARASTPAERQAAYAVFDHTREVATLVCFHGMTHAEATQEVESRRQ